MYQKKRGNPPSSFGWEIENRTLLLFPRKEKKKKLVQRVTRLNMRGLLNMISIDEESFINEYIHVHNVDSQ